MLTKTDEATDSWTESKKKERGSSRSDWFAKTATPQVLMTYYVGEPTDARCFRRYTCTYGSTSNIKI